MNALQTPLRTSKRLPTQLGRRWASGEASKTAATATPKSEAKVNSKDSQGERNHVKWKSVRGMGKKGQWKASSPTDDEDEPSTFSFDKVPSIVLQRPAPTSVHKLKKDAGPFSALLRGCSSFTATDSIDGPGGLESSKERSSSFAAPK